MSIIVTLVCVCAAIDFAFDLPTLLLNPEYWAFQEILDAIP